VATVSRIDKIIGLFGRILSLVSGSFAKETYNFIDPTNQSHPIPRAEEIGLREQKQECEGVLSREEALLT